MSLARSQSRPGGRLRPRGAAPQTHRARSLCRCIVTLTLAWVIGGWNVLPAQKGVSSEKQKLPELGNKPNSLLKIESVKGTIKKIDLQKRTVTIAHSDSETTFAFPTVAGKEKITLSKRVSRAVGKKSWRLEEVPAGSQAKVSYYPELGTIMEIIIEEVAR